MDRRVYIWACIALLVLVIVTKTPLVFSLFALLILGILPGTTLVIPAWILMIVYPMLIIATLAWLSTRPLMAAETPAPVRTTQKKRRPIAGAAKSKVRKNTAAKRRARATV